MPKTPVREIGIRMPKTPIGEFGIRMLNLGNFPHKIPPCYMGGILCPHIKFPLHYMRKIYIEHTSKGAVKSKTRIMQLASSMK